MSELSEFTGRSSCGFAALQCAVRLRLTDESSFVLRLRRRLYLHHRILSISTSNGSSSTGFLFQIRALENR